MVVPPFSPMFPIALESGTEPRLTITWSVVVNRSSRGMSQIVRDADLFADRPVADSIRGCGILQGDVNRCSDCDHHLPTTKVGNTSDTSVSCPARTVMRAATLRAEHIVKAWGTTCYCQKCQVPRKKLTGELTCPRRAKVRKSLTTPVAINFSNRSAKAMSRARRGRRSVRGADRSAGR
jgi:hypothetical protein